MGTMCVPSKTLCYKGLQMGIFGFSQQETDAKNVAMATTQGVIPFLLRCTFLVPSLKNTASILFSRDILGSVFYC